MKIIALILLFVSGSLASNCDSNNCAPTVIKDKFYQLCCLDNMTQLEISNVEYNITFDLGSANVSSCNHGSHDWATIREINTTNCYDVAGESDVIYSLQYPTSPNGGLNITYLAEDIRFTVLLACVLKPDDEKEIKLDTTHTDKDITYITAKGASQYGCAVANSNKVLDFLLEYNYIFAPFLIGIGVLFCFFGLRHFNTVIYTTLIGATVISVGLILEEITSFSWSQLSILVVLVFLILTDLVCTWLKKLPSLGFIIVGSAFGAVNGLIIYNSMLSSILRDREGDTIFYIILSICSLAAAALGAWVQKDGFIIFTAFIGSYMIIRPISALFKNFPSEIAVANGLQDFNTAAYGYLILVLIVASLGAKYQTKYYRDLCKQEKKNDEMIPFVEYMQFF